MDEILYSLEDFHILSPCSRNPAGFLVHSFVHAFSLIFLSPFPFVIPAFPATR